MVWRHLPYETNLTGPQPEVSPGDEATPFCIKDSEQKTYLSEAHPEVVAICLTAWEFAQLINNRDFKYLDSSVEYHLYTSTYRQELIRSKDAKNTYNHFKKYKIKSYCNKVEVVSVWFDKQFSLAEAITRVEIIITEATDKCFKTLSKQAQGKSLAKYVPYRQLYKLNFCKEEGRWKINAFAADSAIIIPD